MALRRGFKSEANAYAREFRQEMGLALHAPLDPHLLAAHLQIDVIPLSSFKEICPVDVAILQEGRRYSQFSAVTIFFGQRGIIIYNDANSPKRQAADIAHEIAHCILKHHLGARSGQFSIPEHNSAEEEEAKWLGPALLVSDEAALYIVENGLSRPRASDFYGVSEEVIGYRLNMTGAFRRTHRVCVV